MPGPPVQARQERLVEAGGLGQQRWPRPHQAQLASHHVDQLGQLVDAAGPQPAPDPGDAGVVGHLEERAGADVLRRQGVELRLGVGGHRPELVDQDRRAAATHPNLVEQDGTGIVQLDQDGHHQADRSGDQQESRGAHHVHHPLDGQGAAAVGPRLQVEEGLVGHGQLAHPSMLDPAQAAGQVHVESGGVQVADDQVELVGGDPVGGHQGPGGAAPLGGGGGRAARPSHGPASWSSAGASSRCPTAR